VESVFPLEEELNLAQHKYPHGLRRRAAEEVAGNSFDHAVANIEKTTGGGALKRQAEQITVSAAQDFESFYSGSHMDGPEPTSNILVMSVDQKGVVMRQEDLRPSTRKAAEKPVQRSGARLNPGEKRNRKRMATVATVYSIEPQTRSPDIHVLEYLWKAAYSFHAVGSKEVEEWVAGRTLKILHGEAEAVAAEMRQSAKLHKLRSAKRKAVSKCADYLEKYDALLDYDVFLNQGLPIATGVIEGACRHLIKDRMDLTGARWGLKRAEAVLRIRSLSSSGGLDSYWSFYQAPERERNYSSLHASIPQALPLITENETPSADELGLQEAA
jgi:hypothetical protein